jgi:hypothetical protein
MLVSRRLRPTVVSVAIVILPADEAAQRHPTAAHESEEQQEDRVLTRQIESWCGRIQATYFFKRP